MGAVEKGVSRVVAPRNVFCRHGGSETPFATAPTALKTHFTHCQHLKRGFEVLALEMSPAPMGAVEKGVSPSCQHVKPPFQGMPPCPEKHISPVAPTPETPFSPCPHALKRGFEVLALGEMCFEGMGAVEKGV